MRKAIAGIVLVLLVSGIAYYFYVWDLFTGHIKREDVEQNFKAHENDFAELVARFDSIIPKDENQSVQFGRESWGRFSLTLNCLDSPINNGINTGLFGGTKLRLNTAAADSILNRLGWNNNDVNFLKEKLSETGCDNISNWHRYQVKGDYIQYKYSGLGLYTYFASNKPIRDSLVNIIGIPFSNTGFGQRVQIEYESPL
jgi:hypothetical protein